MLQLIQEIKVNASNLEKLITPPPALTEYRNKHMLIGLSKELGVKEIAGAGNNMRVVKYHSYARKDNDLKKGLPDSVPWCGSFMCFLTEVYAGMGSVNSMRARDWESWGRSSLKEDTPLPGDIITFYRNGLQSGQGHVGVYLKTLRNGYFLVGGGNQNDEVNISSYSPGRMTDIRRSSKDFDIDDARRSELKAMAENLINGRELIVGGKVT